MGESGQEEPRKKRIKTESGHWIQASYKSSAYKDWREKHKIVAQFGAQEEEEEGEGGSGSQKFGPPHHHHQGHHRFRHKQNARDGTGKGGRSGTVADLRPKAAILKKRQKKELMEKRRKAKRSQRQKGEHNTTKHSKHNTGKMHTKRRKKR